MSNKESIVKSVCTICPKGCGILVHTENSVPIRVEGDPENPLSKGKLCIKGLSTLEYIYHPDRLRHPLMRLGKKGSDNWKQISWDQALDRVAEAFNSMIDAKKFRRSASNYGPDYTTILGGVAIIEPAGKEERFATPFCLGGIGVATTGPGELDEDVAKIGLKYIENKLWPESAHIVPKVEGE